MHKHKTHIFEELVPSVQPSLIFIYFLNVHDEEQAQLQAYVNKINTQYAYRYRSYLTDIPVHFPYC